jgi:hypothetical protein
MLGLAAADDNANSEAGTKPLPPAAALEVNIIHALAKFRHSNLFLTARQYGDAAGTRQFLAGRPIVS